MIEFAAFVPHSPLLVPEIGGDTLAVLRRTASALHMLAESLDQHALDALSIIDGHSPIHENAFSIGLSKEYRTDFSAYGDIVTKRAFSPAIEVINALQEYLRNERVPITLDQTQYLPIGIAAPLTILSKDDTQKIIPISTSYLSQKDHYEFGVLLGTILEELPQRIGVIATGDLSYSHTTHAPMGYRKEAALVDEKIRTCIEQVSASQLLRLPSSLTDAAGCVGHRSLMALLGTIVDRAATPEILSYEHPLGVGFLVARFHI